MNLVTLVGGVAALVSVVSFAPQAFKALATRDLKGISLKSYAITIFGLSLWMAYGVLLKQWPLIVSNALCVSLCIVIVTMKLLRSPKS